MQPLAGAPRHWRRGGRGAEHAWLDDASLRALRERSRARGAAGLMPLAPHIIEELRRVVGRDHVIAGADDLRIFERDASIEGAVPDAVVLPASTQQVSDVMKVAARHRIPVVPRGAGTGLSGGAVTIRGGIALQVTRMRRILEIDPVAQTALVEPGVVNQELSLAAAPHHLFYAPDPSSQKACTIGGNAAENSGGPHCLYYGVTTNHVLGMEVVLADGSVHWVSGDTPDRVGLDLCGLLVGSEGTLCAITRIKVRLLRTPPSIATLLAAFPSIETASQAVSGVISSGIVPAALEMMDQVTVGAVEAHYRAGYPTDAGAVLLVEVDGIPHPKILFDMRDREVLHQVEDAGEEMLRAVVELGGALSGEHGIGLEKNAYMPWVFSPDDLDAMHRVKATLDPDGLLNPGKIFPDPSRRQVRLAGRTGFAVEAKWW